MHFYCINLWQKVIINLWAIATQKFMAKKCVFFLMFYQIIKNLYVFCITLCFFWRKFFIKSDHKFMAKNTVFYDFFLIIKNHMFFCINLCILFCINLWQKVIINLWAIATQKLMAKNVFFFPDFLSNHKNIYVFCIILCFFMA